MPVANAAQTSGNINLINGVPHRWVADDGTTVRKIGLDALRWWNEYKKTGDKSFVLKIAEYCCFDVKVTKCVHEYALEHGVIRYENKAGEAAEVSVDWQK